MANNYDRDQLKWSTEIWKGIDDTVHSTVDPIKIAQQVFYSEDVPGADDVQVDHFDLHTMSIAEGESRPFIEISIEFPLTYTQVNHEAVRKTCQKLSGLASRSLAVAEDLLFFQGAGAALPYGVSVANLEHAGPGLLGLVPGQNVLEVGPMDPKYPGGYGAAILAAITSGISELYSQTQTGPYALILETHSFAATYAGLINGVPVHDVLSPLLTGGIFRTPALPASTGLLVSVNPRQNITVYVGQDPTTTPLPAVRSGVRFLISERVQLTVIDTRALLRLNFLTAE